MFSSLGKNLSPSLEVWLNAVSDGSGKLHFAAPQFHGEKEDWVVEFEWFSVSSRALNVSALPPEKRAGSWIIKANLYGIKRRLPAQFIARNKFFLSLSWGTWTRMECRLFPVASLDYDGFFSFATKVQNCAWSEERRRKRKKHHHIYCFDATLIDPFGVLDANAVHSEELRSWRARQENQVGRRVQKIANMDGKNYCKSRRRNGLNRGSLDFIGVIMQWYWFKTSIISFKILNLPEYSREPSERWFIEVY